MRKARDGDRGDSDALAEAYDLYGARLYGYVLSSLGSAHAAQDIVQEVFCKLAARGALLGIADPERYLFRAAHNEIRRWLRRNRGARGELAAAQRVADVAPAEPHEDERESVKRALAQLPPEQAEVIHLKVYEGMTFAEIARVLRCSANTAASRYRYACEKLRRMLGGVHDERSESGA